MDKNRLLGQEERGYRSKIRGWYCWLARITFDASRGERECCNRKPVGQKGHLVILPRQGERGHDGRRPRYYGWLEHALTVLGERVP